MVDYDLSKAGLGKRKKALSLVSGFHKLILSHEGLHVRWDNLLSEFNDDRHFLFSTQAIQTNEENLKNYIKQDTVIILDVGVEPFLPDRFVSGLIESGIIQGVVRL